MMMSDFYATTAQIVVVMIIFLAVDLPNDKTTGKYKRARAVLTIAGVLEAAALIGLFASGIPRQDWFPVALPWTGAGIVLATLLVLLAYVIAQLRQYELVKEMERLRKKVFGS